MTVLTTFTVPTGARMNPGIEAPDAEGADEAANTKAIPKGGIGLKQEDATRLRIICRLLAIAAFVSCFLASAQTLAQFAYITNNLSDNVSVIDTATNHVITTIAVGSVPDGVAVSPNGSKVYVANILSDSVSVIDTATNTVTATIPVGERPMGVAVSPDSGKVYVANYADETVAVISTATNTVTKRSTSTIDPVTDPVPLAWRSARTAARSMSRS